MRQQDDRAGTRLPETTEDYPGDDILEGAQQIADFLRIKPRKVYAATSELPNGRSRIPVYRIGRTLYARKSTLREWIRQQEAEAM